MSIKQELLDILVCPVCKTPVLLTPEATGLSCSTCRRIYPILDDIPHMLQEAAAISSE